MFDAEMIAMLRVDGAVNTARQVFQDRMNAARELNWFRFAMISRAATRHSPTETLRLANRDAELSMRDAALSKLDARLRRPRC